MTAGSKRFFRGLFAATTVLVAAGCPDWKIDTPLPTEITRISAFRCVIAGAQVCSGRGVEIPAGELPPRDEAFQVWAWHPGANTTSWRLLWDSGYSDNQIHVAFDSVGQSVNLATFPSDIKDIWIRAAIIRVLGTDTTVMARDSIGWSFP